MATTYYPTYQQAYGPYASSGGGTTPPPNTVVAFTKYSDNAPIQSDGDGLDWCSFSKANVRHNAPAGSQIKLGIKMTPGFQNVNGGCVTPAAIGVYDAGTYITQAAVTNEGVSYVTVTLGSASGQRTLELVNSYQQEAVATGQRYGVKVLSCEFLTSGVTASELTVANKDNVSIILGDSTTQDVQSLNVFLTSQTVQSGNKDLGGMTAELRRLRPAYTFINIGAGGKRISTTIDTDSKRRTLAQLMATAYGSASNCVLQDGQAGFNDWNQTQVPSTTIGGYKAAFWPILKSLVPSLRVLNVPMTITTLETTNRANGENGPQYRGGLLSAQTGLESYAYNVKGETLATTDTLYDVIHQKGQGYLNIAAALNPYYDFADPKLLSLRSYSAGNTVGQWNDLSGRGNHLTQPDASRQMQLVTGLNGKKAYRMTSNSFFSVPAISQGPEEYTITIAIKPTAAVQSFLLDFLGDPSGNRFVLTYMPPSAPKDILNGTSSFFNINGFKGPALPEPTDLIIVSFLFRVYQDGGDTAKVYINRSTTGIATDYGKVKLNGTGVLGKSVTDDSAYFQGDFYALDITRGLLSDADRQAIENEIYAALTQ